MSSDLIITMSGTTCPPTSLFNNNNNNNKGLHSLIRIYFTEVFNSTLFCFLWMELLSTDSDLFVCLWLERTYLCLPSRGGIVGNVAFLNKGLTLISLGEFSDFDIFFIMLPRRPCFDSAPRTCFGHHSAWWGYSPRNSGLLIFFPKRCIIFLGLW